MKKNMPSICFSLLLTIWFVTGKVSGEEGAQHVTHITQTIETPAHLASSDELWVGKYSQCSYNAVASVLTYYYGVDHPTGTREDSENSVFRVPLQTTRFDRFYGWGPWTSYMVDSDKMVWNRVPVTHLHAERFSLRPQDLPVYKDQRVTIRYHTGEREVLRARLRAQLARGPVVVWTPYAGGQEKEPARAWHQVTRVDDLTDAVPMRNVNTHSITLFRLPPSARHAGSSDDGSERILVTDCSAYLGVFTTDIDTIISTAASMTAMVRILPGYNNRSIFAAGLDGVKDDEYNVVFFPDAPAGPPPTPHPVSPQGTTQ